jgi:hypothetical protein
MKAGGSMKGLADRFGGGHHELFIRIPEKRDPELLQSLLVSAEPSPDQIDCVIEALDDELHQNMTPDHGPTSDGMEIGAALQSFLDNVL